MKTKILFLHPPFPVNHRHKLVIPISPCQIASYLREKNKDVEIKGLDAHIDELSDEEVLDRINDYNPDIVAIGYWTCQATYVYGISKKIKKMNDKIMIIHGGIHATFMGEEALKSCDVVVVGEAEKTFAELIRAKQKGISFDKVDGILYKKDGKIIATKERDLIEDLDELPYPAFDIFDMKKYIESDRLRRLHVVGGKRMPILGSRGCPYNCSFCLSPAMWKRRVRWKSPDNVIGQIKRMNEDFGITDFQFYDDNFLLNRNFLDEICNRMMKLDFDIRWVCLSRASHVIKEKDILPKLKKAGCIGIEMGLETPDNKILEKINKEQDVDLIGKAVKLQREAGLNPLFTIMVFNPGETITTIRKQREYIEKNIPESLKYDNFGSASYMTLGQFATPPPGTPFYRERKNEGVLLLDDWSDAFHHQINFLPNSFLASRPLAAKQLSRESIDHCIDAAQKSLFKYFPGDKDVEIENKAVMRQIVPKYYSLSDGKRNIKEIAEKISKDTRGDSARDLRFIALATIVLSQDRTITEA